MKKIYFLKSILLLLCMVMGVNAWGDDTYAKITSTEDLEIGKNYLIVYRVNEATTEGYVMGAANGDYMGSVSTTITDNTLTIPTGANVITLGGSSDGYTLLLSANNQYLSGANNTKLGTAESTASNNTKWKISFSNGNAAINNVSATTRYVRNYTSNHTFRHYATSNGMDVQLYKKVETPAYTVTIHSNNDSWGTVSILGNTITAAPEEGYRVKTGIEGYTINSGTATISNNDNNTFTVTPGTDCDITINFEAIPTHAISAVASPAAGGTIELGATSVREGATTTATASANAGYKFTSWSITGTGAELSSTTDNPTTITMGTENATVTANFEAVITHEVNWSVNGVIVKTDNCEEGENITFPTSDPADIAGKRFVGWTLNTINGNTDSKPELITSAVMDDANVTFYAVYGTESMGESNVTMTIDSETTNVPESYGTANDFDECTLEGIKFQIQQMYANGTKLQWRASGNKSGTGTLYNDDALNNIQSIVLTYDASDQNKNFTVNVGNEKNPTGGTTITPSISGSVYTFDCSEENCEYFVLTNGTGAGYLTSLAITYKAQTTIVNDYCTSITSIPVTIGAAGYATLHPEFAVESTKDVTIFTVSKATASDITLSEVLAAKANMPVIVKGSTGTYNLPITTDDEAEAVIGTADNANLLTYGTLSTNDYVLYNGDAGVGFYQWVGSDVENRVYLPAAKVPSGAKFLAFSFNEETGIEKISMAADKEEEAKWFNLAGQRISQPTKGMYIVRGKKVVVK